tara:strand:- start:22 stop:297 length:276 start_codon:yes stop_codon:yes gene_type:complete
MNTQENNKLIAEFMGLAPNECGVYQTKRGPYHLENLSYHLSWDWLMPVVQKCYKIDDEEGFDNLVDAVSTLDINGTYQAVVEFINEYNKTK